MSYATKRLERLRAVMVREGFDVFYLRATSNIQWLTGFDGVFDTEDAHALILSSNTALFHTDSRYGEAARRAAQGSSIIVDARGEQHTALLFEVADDITRSLRRPLTIAIESNMSLGEYRILEREIKAHADDFFLKETTAVVRGIRAVKDAEEVRRLKAAQAITDAAYAHITRFIRPGMTEREVQIELEDYMIRRGAHNLAFSSIVACGENGALPHAISGDKTFEVGQSVVLDFGARSASYCSDMTRTLFIGEPSQELRRAYAVLCEANESVEAFLRPGITGAQAHKLALGVLERAGYEKAMGHSLGHGLGLDIHEEPLLSARNTQELVVGNVLTVEPGIYKAGSFGMRLEDFGMIVEGGFEVFTQSSHDMVII